MKTDWKEIIESISLETKIKVGNEMAFINLITELGYRPNKMWTDEENELLSKLLKLAGEHTKRQLKEVEDELDAKQNQIEELEKEIDNLNHKIRTR